MQRPLTGLSSTRAPAPKLCLRAEAQGLSRRLAIVAGDDVAALMPQLWEAGTYLSTLKALRHMSSRSCSIVSPNANQIGAP